MSIESFESIPEEPEHVAGRPIAIALVWTVVGTLLCTLVVLALMRFEPVGGGRSDEARPALIPPANPFDAVTGLEAIRAQQQSQLDHYAWADREHQVVRVPIEVAIDRVLGGAR